MLAHWFSSEPWGHSLMAGSRAWDARVGVRFSLPPPFFWKANANWFHTHPHTNRSMRARRRAARTDAKTNDRPRRRGHTRTSEGRARRGQQGPVQKRTTHRGADDIHRQARDARGDKNEGGTGVWARSVCGSGAFEGEAFEFGFEDRLGGFLLGGDLDFGSSEPHFDADAPREPARHFGHFDEKVADAYALFGVDVASRSNRAAKERDEHGGLPVVAGRKCVLALVVVRDRISSIAIDAEQVVHVRDLHPVVEVEPLLLADVLVLVPAVAVRNPVRVLQNARADERVVEANHDAALHHAQCRIVRLQNVDRLPAGRAALFVRASRRAAHRRTAGLLLH